MQASGLIYQVATRAQVQMVGIPQDDLRARFLDPAWRYGFDRARRSDRHENRGGDVSMGGMQDSGTGPGTGRPGIGRPGTGFCCR